MPSGQHPYLIPITAGAGLNWLIKANYWIFQEFSKPVFQALEIGPVESIYTMKIGTHYKSVLLPSLPQSQFTSA